MKKKFNFNYVLVTVLTLVISGIGGALLGMTMVKNPENFFKVGAALFVSMYLQLILHEGGHLVCGLLSGYKFVSFRIANIILIKKRGKLYLKKASLPGTAGQCLLSPPDFVNDTIPFTLYNLGGVIFNVVFALIGLLAKGYFGITFFLVGLVLAINNGIPVNTALVNNDGSNLVNLKKNPKAVKAFWITLKTNELNAEDVSLTAMDESYFLDINSEEGKNPLIASIAYLNGSRYLFSHEFEKVIEYNSKCVKEFTGLEGIQKQTMQMDLIIAQLLTDKEITEPDKTFKKMLKSLNGFIDAERFNCIYALLKENDLKKADKHLEKFNKLNLAYPYYQDGANQKALIDLAYTKYKTRS